MIRRVPLVFLVACAALSVSLPSASATTRRAAPVPAAAPSASSAGCPVGQICEIDQSVPGFTQQQKLPKGADPAGHMLRALIMIIIFAIIFIVYVAWALQRGTTPAS